jgi:acetyltransferase-like isoleucine patch superfamily enzyme
VTVHERVVVGAAAVVMRDVGPDVVVAGNPAKVIGPRVIDRP